MKTTLHWHFSRSDLAGLYLDNLETGLMSSAVIFAPRKKGKTEFLREDLLPLAQQRGYRVVYCSMWENRSDPLGALQAALTDAAKPRNFGQKVGQVLGRAAGSIELTIPALGNLKTRAELPKADQAAQNLLTLPTLMDTLIKSADGPVLLALDEVQHLAKPEFHDFVAALRSCLDIRKHQVKSIFTGSSRNRLQAMFSEIRAPLFQFSQTTNFPDLGDAFVDFMSTQFQASTGRQLSSEEARTAFALTGHTPGLYREALLKLIVAGSTDILGAVELVLELSRNESGYLERFDMMRALDREVMAAVVEKVALYSEPTLARFAQRLGVAVTARQVQGAVERLLSEQIIYRQGPGSYEIEDPQLAEWLKSAPGTEPPATGSIVDKRH